MNAQDGTKCCSRCLKISARLEKLIDRDFGRRDKDRERDWRDLWEQVTESNDLDHLLVEHTGRRECSLCNFLTHMLEAGRACLGDRRFTAKYNLYIGSA